MVPGIDLKVDYAFKRVFGVPETRRRLIALLNAVLDPQPEKRVTEVEIIDPFNRRQFESDKLTVLDLHVLDQSGRQFDVEMQMLVHPWLEQRLLYYWAKMYSGQMVAGEDYSALRPAVLICFVGDRLLPGHGTYHQRFRPVSAEGIRFFEDFELHTIELGRLPNSPTDLVTPLDRWAWFMEHADELEKDRLPVELKAEPQIEDAFEELILMSQTQEDRVAYESRMKFLRDEYARLKYSQEAEEIGRQKGIKEGIKEGIQQERHRNLVNRIRDYQEALGEPVTEEAVLLPKSDEELAMISDSLFVRLKGLRAPSAE